MAPTKRPTIALNLKTGLDEAMLEEQHKERVESGELDEEGTLHFNHSARVIAFGDGTIIPPGGSARLDEETLKHPVVKRLLRDNELRTEEAHVPEEPTDELEPGSDVDGEPGHPKPGTSIL